MRLAASVMVVVLAVSGCEPAAPTPEEIAAARDSMMYVEMAAYQAVNREWTEAGRWEGSGNKTTERFQIQGDEWRIVYGGGFTAGMPGIVGFVVRRADGSVVSTAYVERPGQETTHIQSGPGSYYLEVSATVNWVVVVQDYRPAPDTNAAEAAASYDDLRNR